MKTQTVTNLSTNPAQRRLT